MPHAHILASYWRASVVVILMSRCSTHTVVFDVAGTSSAPQPPFRHCVCVHRLCVCSVYIRLFDRRRCRCSAWSLLLRRIGIISTRNWTSVHRFRCRQCLVRAGSRHCRNQPQPTVKVRAAIQTHCVCVCVFSGCAFVWPSLLVPVVAGYAAILVRDLTFVYRFQPSFPVSGRLSSDSSLRQLSKLTEFSRSF